MQTRAMFGCPPSLTAAETGRAAARAEAVATARNIDRIRSMALIAALVGALVIEAILIWAIIGLSLGPAGQAGARPRWTDSTHISAGTGFASDVPLAVLGRQPALSPAGNASLS